MYSIVYLIIYLNNISEFKHLIEKEKDVAYMGQVKEVLNIGYSLPNTMN